MASVKNLLISFSIIFTLLIFNELSAQPSIIEYNLKRGDTLSYAINAKGDTVFRGKFQEDNLRFLDGGKTKWVVNVKGDTLYRYKETIPEFPEGQMAMFRFLAQNIRYPRSSREDGAQGTIYVGFVVDIDGSLKDINIKHLTKVFNTTSEKKRKKLEAKIPETSYVALKEEAIRVVTLMPRWKPGTQQDKPVRVAYTLPIKFKLE